MHIQHSASDLLHGSATLLHRPKVDLMLNKESSQSLDSCSLMPISKSFPSYRLNNVGGSLRLNIVHDGVSFETVVACTCA